MSTKSRAPARDPAQGYCNTHIQQSPQSFTNQFMNILQCIQCDVEHFLGCKWISHSLTHHLTHSTSQLVSYAANVIHSSSKCGLYSNIICTYLIVLVTMHVLHMHNDACTVPVPPMACNIHKLTRTLPLMRKWHYV